MTRRMWLLMALLAALWGSSYLFVKVALQEGVEPVCIVFARLALGALVLVPIAWRRGALAPLRGALGPIALVATVQIVLPFLLIAYGERFIASSQTGILFAATPIWAVLLAHRHNGGEHPGAGAVLGVLTGLVGVAFLLGVDLGGGREAIAGGALVLLATIAYAIGSLYFKRRLEGARAIGAAAGALLTGALLLVPVVGFALPAHLPSLWAVGSLLALGAGGTGLAFAINYTLIAEIGPDRASLVAYIAPGCAVIYGVALLGEPLGVGVIVGLVLILGGSWIAAREPRPKRTPPVTPRVPHLAREEA